MGDAELGAGIASQMRTVAAAVVSQDLLTVTLCQVPGFVEGVSSGCSGCLLGGVGSGLFRRGWGVSVLVFFWGVHVDRGMRADGVVPVDPLGRRDLQVVDGVPGALVSDQFGFIQRVECLGEHGDVGTFQWRGDHLFLRSESLFSALFRGDHARRRIVSEYSLPGAVRVESLRSALGRPSFCAHERFDPLVYSRSTGSGVRSLRCGSHEEEGRPHWASGDYARFELRRRTTRGPDAKEEER